MSLRLAQLGPALTLLGGHVAALIERHRDLNTDLAVQIASVRVRNIIALTQNPLDNPINRRQAARHIFFQLNLRHVDPRAGGRQRWIGVARLAEPVI